MNPAGVIAAARAWIGHPYRTSGRGPSYVDCVGLVYRVMVDTGNPRLVGQPSPYSNGAWTVSALAKLYRDRGAVSSSLADAQPGDVLVFGADEHVGIYSGGGMVISALTSGVAETTVSAVRTVKVAAPSFRQVLRTAQLAAVLAGGSSGGAQLYTTSTTTRTVNFGNFLDNPQTWPQNQTGAIDPPTWTHDTPLDGSMVDTWVTLEAERAGSQDWGSLANWLGLGASAMTDEAAAKYKDVLRAGAKPYLGTALGKLPRTLDLTAPQTHDISIPTQAADAVAGAIGGLAAQLGQLVLLAAILALAGLGLYLIVTATDTGAVSS